MHGVRSRLPKQLKYKEVETVRCFSESLSGNIWFADELWRINQYWASNLLTASRTARPSDGNLRTSSAGNQWAHRVLIRYNIVRVICPVASDLLRTRLPCLTHGLQSRPSKASTVSLQLIKLIIFDKPLWPSTTANCCIKEGFILEPWPSANFENTHPLYNDRFQTFPTHPSRHGLPPAQSGHGTTDPIPGE